jgi:hypothetical protein
MNTDGEAFGGQATLSTFPSVFICVHLRFDLSVAE